jgi:PEP-CTERM motif
MGISHLFKRSAVAGAALFLSTGLFQAAPARADVLTYTFDPFTHFTFQDLESAVLIGTFTVNPPGDDLSADDIVITGTGQEAGTYGPEESGDNELLYVDSTTSNELFLIFNEDLGAAHLQLTEVEWAGGSGRSSAIELGGGAHLPTAAPEPSTWAMMLLGFAGLGYAAVRRKAAPRMA